MKIGITGASGLIGTPLVRSLREHGHDVVRFVRGSAGAADERWTDARKAVVLGSRVDGTTTVARAMAEAAAAGQGPKVLLSSSGVNYYGDTGDRLTDETGPTGTTGFLPEVCRQWEASAASAAEAGVRVAVMRTGPVLTGKGGILGRQLLIFKAGLGAPLGSGRQWLSWISLQDTVSAMRHLLTADVEGPVNLVSPTPVTNREFTTAMGRALHRPTLPVPVPGAVLRLAIGPAVDEIILIGQRLAPSVLQRSGFAFAHSDLGAALRASL